MVLFEPSFLSASCPYVQFFADTFKKQRDRKDLASAYVFQQQILQLSSKTEKEFKVIEKGLKAFVDQCGPICIVSLKNNWIYSIVPSVEDAKTLPAVFNFFKSK